MMQYIPHVEKPVDEGIVLVGYSPPDVVVDCVGRKEGGRR